MDGPRTARIRAILEKRRKPAQLLTALLGRLETTKRTITESDALRQKLLADPVVTDDVRSRLEAVPIRDMLLRIGTVVDLVGRLQIKFTRETLNIGVVGKAGQGKSSLLQSMTGLNEAEVPTSKSKHCTGVSAQFVNQAGDIGGKVWFHSESSFIMEVLAPYYSESDGGLDLGNLPTNLEAFRRNPLPALPAKYASRSAEPTIYENLKLYHEQTGSIRTQTELMDRSKRIGRADIRRYTAQIDSDGTKLTDWMAVRDVQIFCEFPAHDVGPICLFDTPGVGDTRPGEMSRIFRVLQNQIDFVLFVRRPNDVDRGWEMLDLNLYDRAKLAMEPIPINRCSMLVLNRMHPDAPTDTLAQCQEYVQEMGPKNLRFTHHAIVDCSQAEEVRVQILDWVVDYFANQIESLDQILLDTLHQELTGLRSDLEQWLATAAVALGESHGGGNETAIFLPRFHHFWKQLRHDLTSLVEAMLKNRDTPDEGLREAIAKAIERAEAVALPSEAEVAHRARLEGGFFQAYGHLLDEYRVKVLQGFMGLNDCLKSLIGRMFDRVTETIASTPLGQFSPVRGREFLVQIQDVATGSAPAVARSLDSLLGIQLTYRGLIQHRVGIHLDRLRPNRAKPLPGNPNEKQVANIIQTSVEESLYHIRTSLAEILAEPNQAIFAEVEEFVDTAIRAEDAEQQWHFLLDSIRGEIWKSEFDALGQRSRRRLEWAASVTRVRDTLTGLAVSP